MQHHSMCDCQTHPSTVEVVKNTKKTGAISRSVAEQRDGLNMPRDCPCRRSSTKKYHPRKSGPLRSNKTCFAQFVYALL